VSRPSLAVLGVLFLTALASGCDKVPLLAPTESTITLNVSTTTVPVNGTAQIIASVTEKPGTPVQNGTVVTFTSSFGTIEPAEAETENGKATVVFRAGQQSGTAVIGAFSGAARAQTLEVKVGGAAAATLVVRAQPQTVSANGGSSEIVATVLDASGNPLPGVPVTFSTDAGQVNPGQSVTDSNGEARSTLTTSRNAVVTARVADKSATVSVVASSPAVTITVPPNIEAGVAATFTLTPATGGNPIRDVVIDWGDGTAPTRLGSISGATQVAHVFPRAGVFVVTVTVTDVQGISASSSVVVNVNEQTAIAVSLGATPNPVSVGTGQGLVTFQATVGGGLGGGASVSSYTWDFGDGQGAVTTGGSTNHRYGTPGTYIATVVARAANGTQGSNQVTVRVTP
jgi:adhesin/invasin